MFHKVAGLESDLGNNAENQKCRDLFFGCTPPEQKHLLLCQRQFARREFVDPEQEMRSMFDKLCEGVRGETAHRHGVDSVCRKAVTIRRHRPEKISGQCKPDHLPSPIGQQLVQARHTRGHVVDGSGGLADGEESLIGSQMDVAGDPFEFGKIGLVERAADAERADGAGRAAAEIGAK